jgi:acyl transferase domain-containing protein/acyl carrier protein
MSKRMSSVAASDIAIIGMAGRFPGAPDIDTFFNNLKDGVESVRFFSEQEVVDAGIPEEDARDPSYVKAALQIDEPEYFDASFFNCSPSEAEFTDPQQRIFLEAAYHSLESAGYDPSSYEGKIGLFGGVGTNFYQYTIMGAKGAEVMRSPALRLFLLHGNEKDYLTTRTSYRLNLRGPSMAVQCACSTSLVAVHLACRSILARECDMAMAGGVAVKSSYRKAGYRYAPGGIVASDGHCRPFDAGASGTVFGDGVGLVVLKALDKAIADGDNIRAVIKSSAVNNDGANKVGYAAPSPDGQVAVILDALNEANISPESIGCVEAHGTATELGDPIEVASLTQAFRTQTQKRAFCALGSVKGNIGHVDTAAGIAGLIKAVLSVERGALLPTINFRKPNQHIDFENSPFYVNVGFKKWPEGEQPRRVAINSFGIGGTNAHVIIEEPPARVGLKSERESHCLLVSARSSRALDKATANLVKHLEQHPDLDVADVAHTLFSGRKQHRYSRFIFAEDCQGVSAAVNDPDSAPVFTGQRTSAGKRLVFMFPGQGTQHVGMGQSLYESETVYRDVVDHCATVLRGKLGFDLRDTMFAERNLEEASKRLAETSLAQPAIFTTSYAMTQLLMSWGVRPQAMIGHSVGELVAATVAGVFSLEQALEAVVARGRFMQAAPRGAMLAVLLTPKQAEEYVGPNVSIAAINGPAACVLSGRTEDIDRLEQALSAEGVSVARLHTSHAFHSEMMDGAVQPFVDVLSKYTLKEPEIPLVSNVTGARITAEQATDPNYWGSQIRNPVLFSEGLKSMASEGEAVFLEVGPGKSLSGLASMALLDSGRPKIFSTMPIDAKEQGVSHFRRALTDTWFAGANVEWTKLYSGEKRNRVELPGYPFERKRYWVERDPAAAEAAAAKARASSSPSSHSIDDAFYAPSWKRLPPHAYVKNAAAARKWLVFSNGDKFCGELIARLKEAGTVIVVERGTGFAQKEPAAFTVNVEQKDDFSELFRELAKSEAIPESIVYLWSSISGALEVLEYEIELYRAFLGPVYLAQTIDELAKKSKIELNVIARDSQSVFGEKCPGALSSLAKGACLVGPVENPNLACRYIDLAGSDLRSGDQSGLLDMLSRDLLEPPTASVVAYRGSNRWSSVLEQIKLRERDRASSPIREGGVYLVTGGLGDLGLEIATAIADTVTAKLVLCGRSIFPDRSEWEGYLATGGKWTKAIKALQAIEAKGSKVMVTSADVADQTQVSNLKQSIEESFGSVNGIVHAAGVAWTNLMRHNSRDKMLYILLPKVVGTELLALEFGGRDLDFFAVFSSVSSLSGHIGHVDYCAANSYLDAFAQGASGGIARTVVSINWDLWNETGMAVREGVPEALRAKFAMGIRTQEGVDAFFRILETKLPQIVVSKLGGIEPPTPNKAAAVAAGNGNGSGNGGYERTENGEVPADDPDYVAPRTELEEIVAGLLAQLLGLGRVGMNDNFFELGGHSLLALQLVGQVRQRFGIFLSPRELFTSPIVSDVAALIESRLVADIGKKLSEEEAVQA